MMKPMPRTDSAPLRAGGRSRHLALALALGFGVPAATVSASAQAEQRKTLGADVKIEIKQPDGKVVTHRTQLGSFDMNFEFAFEGAGSKHEVLLNVRRDGDSKKNLIVTVGYDKDGKAIFAPFETDWKANKRDVLRTEDGKFAIALTIKPKMVKYEDKSRDEGDQIEPDDSDDPLGGL